jgi:hypothetical protein
MPYSEFMELLSEIGIQGEAHAWVARKLAHELPDVAREIFGHPLSTAPSDPTLPHEWALETLREAEAL